MKIFITGHVSPDLDSTIATVAYAEFLEKTKRYGDTEIVPVIPEEPNTETKAVFEKFGVDLPEVFDNFQIESDDKIILVDHNEIGHRHNNGHEPENILEIIDHHKVEVAFAAPLRLDIRPLGSTSTIIYEIFDIYHLEPEETTKRLILAAILSDTQGLKSSTTTDTDIQIAHEISKELDIDLDQLTFEIFKAKSDIAGLLPKDLVTRDYKVFDMSGEQIFINQIETVEPQLIFDIEDKIIEAMKELKTKLDVDKTYVVVTDILKVNSKVIFTDEEEKFILEKAFESNASGNFVDIGPKMSRKKDIAPRISIAMGA